MKIFILLLAGYFISACGSNEKPERKDEGRSQVKMKMQLESSAFEHEGMIPSKYTCDAENISPPLRWQNIPEGTKSLALICDDPDAPSGDWVHWVVYNVPPAVNGLDEKMPRGDTLSIGALQGITDFNKTGYGGPCPPSGTHRYFFKLYALDKMLKLEAGATKQELLDAMEDHIIGKTELMGRYKRNK